MPRYRYFEFLGLVITSAKKWVSENVGADLLDKQQVTVDLRCL